MKVADPEAGRLDDFQIATPRRLDAYQFKWATFPTTVTYNDLTKETKASLPGGANTPGLLAQLADGWKRLAVSNPGRRVVVHLVTNENPTDNKSAVLPVGTPPPTDGHLAAFFAQAWPSVREGTKPPEDAVPAHWKDTLVSVRKETGLSDAEFVRFVRDCEFDFGETTAEVPSETVANRQRQRDLDRLRQYFQDVVTSARKEITLTLDVLLERLGWGSRIEYRNRHEFPDPAHYAPIDDSIRQFEERLTTLRGGYVAVVGPPGSGKSTLLTQALRRQRPERVVRYYAFVPDAQNPALSRGEAVNFFHDVTLSLRRMGVGNQFGPMPDDLQGQREAFGRALLELGREFRESDLRTILLIDGLDHIDRELRPIRSLLAELPSPGELPDGVFIVFGTQTDQLPDLARAVRHSLDDDGRRVTMVPLSRSAVFDITRRASAAPLLSSTQLERLHHLSDGHPLALTYLLGAVSRETTPEGVDSVLDAETPYRGDIELMYRNQWEVIRQAPDAVRLLGGVCRMRTAPFPELLERWFGSDAVGRVADVIRRYFRVDTDGRWRIFHNSFRLFLVRETARAALTRTVDDNRNRAIHRELADRCASEPSDTAVRWEELFHRVQADDHEGVCRLAALECFRSQLAAGRPLDAIKTDTELARQSALRVRDPLAFARMVFASDEWERRSHSLDQFDLAELCLLSGDIARAVEAIRDGNRLRVDETAALGFAVRLSDLGHLEEGKRLFDLAEPLDMLAGTGDNPTGDRSWKVLREWASAAPLFRPLPEVLDRVATIRAPERSYQGDDQETGDRHLRAYLSGDIGRRLADRSRWDELPLILDRLSLDAGSAEEARFHLLLDAAHTARRSEDIPRRDEILRRLREDFEPHRLGGERRLLLAELLAFCGNLDSARAVLADGALAAPDFNPMTGGEQFARFARLFRHARLLAWLGDRRSPLEMVPELEKERGREVRFFLSDVIRVAQIEATWLRGDQIDPTRIPNELMGLLRRFHTDLARQSAHALWDCQSARVGLYRHLVHACALHGGQALAVLKDEFSVLWAGPTARYWWSDIRREVARAFAEEDPAAFGDWAAAVLDEMEAGLTEDTDPHTAVRSLDSQAAAWVELGRPERVGQLYARAVAVSARLSGEDYQIDGWMRAFEHFADGFAAEARNRLEWMAGGLYSVRESADRGPLWSAAKRLLRLAARLDPKAAVGLFVRFRDHGLLQHTDGLMALAWGWLDRPDPPARLLVYLIGDLVIPLERSADGELVGAVIRALHTNDGAVAAEWATEYLFRRAAVYGFARAKSQWWRGLEPLLDRLGIAIRPAVLTTESGRTSEESRDEKRSVGESSLLRFDSAEPMHPVQPVGVPDTSIADVRRTAEEPVSLERVLAAIDDTEQLLRWASKEHYTSQFDWIPVVEKLRQGGRVADLRRLLATERVGRSVVKWLLGRGQAALRSGDRVRAAEFARLALVGTTRYDWSRRQSEGHRLDACSLLVSATADGGRTEVWRTLEAIPCTDPASTLELLGLLLLDESAADCWQLAEDRLRIVFDSTTTLPPAVEPVHLGEGDNPAACLAALLLDHASHPVGVVCVAARRACARALRDGDRDLMGVIRTALGVGAFTTAVAVELLATAGDQACLSGLRAELIRLCRSEDLAVAVTARRLCVRAKIERPEDTTAAPRGGRSSRLVAASLSHLYTPRDVIDGQPLPDTDPPEQILYTVMHLIRFAAAESGEAERDLIQRAVLLMQRLLPESWSASAERQLRLRLDGAGLKMTFVRPRSRVVNMAARQLFGELWRDGRFSDEVAEMFCDELQHADPDLFFVEPRQRPVEIQGIEGSQVWEREVREWLDRTATETNRLLDRLTDGRVVLAESSTLEFLARTLRTEIRLSGTFTQSTLPSRGTDREEWWPSSSVWRLRGYPAIEAATSSLVIRHEDRGCDSPGANWLAFNPILARRLGWRHDPSGLFCWRAPDGTVAVESIWWEDGPVGDRHHWTDETVGRGWLVVANPTAIERIVTDLGELFRHRKMTRIASLDEEGKVTRTANPDPVRLSLIFRDDSDPPPSAPVGLTQSE